MRSPYRIHGTDAPWTIGQIVSRGCIRMHNEHFIELYEKVGTGMKVTATWQRFNAKQIETAQTVGSDWLPWQSTALPSDPDAALFCCRGCRNTKGR